MFTKSRSSASSYPVQMGAADRTVTIALPSATHDANRAAELATLQYQQELLADFFSGSAAPRPRPPPPASSSGHSHSSSHGSSSKSKLKWGAADAKAKVAAGAYPEPTTLSKRMFQFGFACPLLWLAGVVFLWYPPRPRIEHEGLPVNSDEERGRRVAVYKFAETKWGQRCLAAWAVFVAIVVIVVPGVAVGVRSGH